MHFLKRAGKNKEMEEETMRFLFVLTALLFIQNKPLLFDKTACSVHIG